MKNKNLNIESGRSMVEMLGVLAVMGVLSVGGVAMYTNAMNKLKANELLYEASKRATVMVMQFSTGREKASCAEFLDNSVFAGGTFDDLSEIYPKNGQFKIKIRDILPTVCNQMKASVGNNTLVRKVVCSNSEKDYGYLFFNIDGSKVDPQGPICDIDNDIYCHYGQICSTNGEVAGTCISGKNFSCLTNDDCLKDETYCQIETDTNGHISDGKCVDIGGSSGEKIIEGLGVFERSNLGMNWWSARNWCVAKGKHLFNVNHLGCYHGTELLHFGSTGTSGSYCCAYNEDNDECTYGSEQTQAMQKLIENFGAGEAGWSSTDKNDSHSYRLLLGYSSNHNRNVMVSYDRSSTAFRAFCEE